MTKMNLNAAKQDYDRAVALGYVDFRFIEAEGGQCFELSKPFQQFIMKYKPTRIPDMIEPMLDFLKYHKKWTREDLDREFGSVETEKGKKEMFYLADVLFKLLKLIQEQGIDYE